MSRSRAVSVAVFAAIALGCLGCDQLTKGVARTELSAGAPTLLAGGAIRLALTENPGAFLSAGASLPEGVRRGLLQVGVPILLILLCAVVLRRSAQTTWSLVGIALLAGGGMGNWLDRIFRGGLVTDFVTLSIGPFQTGVFNAADIAILLGVALLVGTSGKAFPTRTT